MWKRSAILPILLLSAASALAQDTNVFRLRVGTAITGSDEYQIAKNADGCRLTGKLHTVRPTGTLMSRTNWSWRPTARWCATSSRCPARR